jgi:UDP-N-acetylmuramoyl-tripeptide--D-alanyl-D-alanine ligase
MFSDYSLITFSLVASLSPLLVLAYLWQLKEWRWDRLGEHLRRENPFGQLLGILRPVIVILSLALLLIPGMPVGQWARTAVGLLALLTLLRVLLRKQPRPRWTEKAIVLVVSALLLDLLLLTFLSVFHRTGFFIAAAVLPIIQFFALVAAWLLWKPVDAVLKRQILAKARELRALREDLTVIGVTGSVGKTTAKELLACILKPLNAIATPAYVNSEMGVAKWLLQVLAPTHAPVHMLIVEMGAYRGGEIDLLCRIARPCSMIDETKAAKPGAAQPSSSDSSVWTKSSP